MNHEESTGQGPNQKRYEIASRPRASEADAKIALEQYLHEVSKHGVERARRLESLAMGVES